MPCDKAIYRIKPLLIIVIGTLFLCVCHEPGSGADKIRVAFSAVSPTQGVLWVADVRWTFKQKRFQRRNHLHTGSDRDTGRGRG